MNSEYNKNKFIESQLRFWRIQSRKPETQEQVIKNTMDAQFWLSVMHRCVRWERCYQHLPGCDIHAVRGLWETFKTNRLGFRVRNANL